MRRHASSSSSDGQANQLEASCTELELVKTRHMEEIEAMKNLYKEELSNVKAHLGYVLSQLGR